MVFTVCVSRFFDTPGCGSSYIGGPIDTLEASFSDVGHTMTLVKEKGANVVFGSGCSVGMS